MKILIIDDENKARKLLEVLLLESSNEIAQILEASNLEEGVAIIKREQPNIVFLDIEMPNHSGLQILEFFEDQEVNFQIIFTTAYNQYAVDAFKLSAIDYLLKPIDEVELKIALEKAIAVVKQKSVNSKLEDLKKAFQQLSLNKIALEIPKGIIFVNHDDIIFFEADAMYTLVYLQNGKTELICKPLKHFVDQLENKNIFYKPHRKYLINLKHIKELSKKDGFFLIMENNKTIPIARDKKEEFIKIIQEVF
ncbi:MULTISPECIES: LytTR family DNA-binding domain-containing protein [unclassified Flavobacterium]|uniref:LytR/AlgR family response regulator transcription factor n=1 Tax=unclassified Flavobacterium TaxID=196869 RepID=UPI0012921AF3|nr:MULTISPECIES: LytTR family DNA-binding domain-containing protein [unclassified Flavobacterium]MQP53250.1 response regulator [Flavobacterium sp. LMO9]MQP63261.1 response regulator [Flavobacterium sp. LMO6]